MYCAIEPTKQETTCSIPTWLVQNAVSICDRACGGSPVRPFIRKVEAATRGKKLQLQYLRCMFDNSAWLQTTPSAGEPTAIWLGSAGADIPCRRRVAAHGTFRFPFSTDREHAAAELSPCSSIWNGGSSESRNHLVVQV